MMLVATLVFVFGSVFAKADSLNNIYNEMNTRYPGEINTMKASGATEQEIQNFIGALENELNKYTLTDENVNDALANSVFALYLSESHNNMFEAVDKGWNLNGQELLNTFISGGTNQVISLLPESFVAISDLVMNGIVDDNSNTGGSGSSGGGGGGGGSAAEDDSVGDIDTQIKNNNSNVSVIMEKDNNSVKISVADINQIFAANKNMEVSNTNNEVKFIIPANALNMENASNVNLSVEKVTKAENESLTAKIPQGQKLVSNIYELTISNADNSGENISFNKAIKIAISYDDANFTSADEDNLSIYWFNEDIQAWVHVGGRVNKENKTVEMDAGHLSKYAIMTKPPVDNTAFGDLNNHWAKQDIEFLVSRNIVKGVSSDKFQPNRSITRAEFATMLVNMLNIDTTGVNGFHFSDVPAQAWYAKIVYTAVDAKLVKGVSPTSFAPKQNITRQEMAAMVSNALAYKKMPTNVTQEELNNLKKYQDKGKLSSWAEKSVAIAMKNGIITGRTSSTLAPQANATRAEAAVMMKRLFLLVD